MPRWLQPRFHFPLSGFFTLDEKFYVLLKIEQIIVFDKGQLGR